MWAQGGSPAGGRGENAGWVGAGSRAPRGGAQGRTQGKCGGLPAGGGVLREGLALEREGRVGLGGPQVQRGEWLQSLLCVGVTDRGALPPRSVLLRRHTALPMRGLPVSHLRRLSAGSSGLCSTSAPSFHLNSPGCPQGPVPSCSARRTREGGRPSPGSWVLRRKDSGGPCRPVLPGERVRLSKSPLPPPGPPFPRPGGCVWEGAPFVLAKCWGSF